MKKPVIYVVGDSMLDVDVDLVSIRTVPADPDAPVIPFVDIDDPGSKCSAGGAANVACNAASMGADVTLITSISTDRCGTRLRVILAACGVKLITPNNDRRTTTKTTYRYGGRVVARYDVDIDTDPYQLFTHGSGLTRPDALILTDYGRGALDRKALFSWSGRWSGLPTYGDPKTGRVGMWTDVYGLETFVLNREEAHALIEESLTGSLEMRPDEIDRANAPDIIQRVHEIVKTPTVVLKLGPHGSMVSQKLQNAPGSTKTTTRGYSVVYVPVVNCGAVKDVKGAGDTYIAALALGRYRGLNYEDAGLYASTAAGLAVSRSGTSVIGETDIAFKIKSQVCGRRGVLSYADAVDLSERLRACGVNVGYTGGCFDLRLSPGHINTIETADSMCEFLFVGVDSDARVRKLKGPTRPVIADGERADVLSRIVGVGAAFVFDKDAPDVVNDLRPDVLFKGGGYDESTMPEVPVLKSYGGRFVHTGVTQCPSTTETIAAITAKTE